VDECAQNALKPRIRRFLRLQIFRVSYLHPGEVCKAGFPLLGLCSTAVGLEVGKTAFFVEGTSHGAPSGKLASQ